MVSPVQPFSYTLSGATTATGSGTASGLSFNGGITTVTYVLTGSPSVNCFFTVTVNTTLPQITTQPSAQTVCAGANVTFTLSNTMINAVELNGLTPLTTSGPAGTGAPITYGWTNVTANQLNFVIIGN